LRCASRIERGLGLALFTWLTLAIVYDGAVLGLVAALGAYPIERSVLALILLNPIDLARVLMLLQLDVSALMGYTGAVFQQFFGTSMGLVLALAALTVWCAVPFFAAARRFARKDF
jgi:Cu-processing system permease protein